VGVKLLQGLPAACALKMTEVLCQQLQTEGHKLWYLSACPPSLRAA